MRRILLLPLLLLVGVLGQGTALAAMIFESTLTGGQEVLPVATTASGTATLFLNDPMDRLEIFVQLFGLDLDGQQTPGDPNDDIINMHIHAAPAGLNGSIVFGFISPNSDTNGDLVIDPIAGTLFSGWDLNEGFGTTLDGQLTNLLNAGLYVNVHTRAFPAGEIRGQILAVPIPGTAALLMLGLTLLCLDGILRRRTTLAAPALGNTGGKGGFADELRNGAHRHRLGDKGDDAHLGSAPH